MSVLRPSGRGQVGAGHLAGICRMWPHARSPASHLRAQDLLNPLPPPAAYQVRPWIQTRWNGYDAGEGMDTNPGAWIQTW